MSPPSAALDGFDWRLSLAGVTAPGPFSAFPGVDRTLCVLEGVLELEVEGAAGPRRLDPQSAAWRFPGDVEVFGRPIGGPVTDLNLMVRRAAFVGSVRRQPAGFAPPAPSKACATVLVAAASMTVRVGPVPHDLDRFDALLFDPDGPGEDPVWLSAPAIAVTVHAKGGGAGS